MLPPAKSGEAEDSVLRCPPKGDTVLSDDPTLRDISNLAEEYLAAQARVGVLSRQLKAAIAEMNRISLDELPKAMANAGMLDFTLTDGQKVAVTSKFNGTKLVDPVGLSWVEEHGGDSLIKTTITVEMDRGDLDVARELMQMLQQHRAANRYKKLTLDASIHQSTIASWAKEMVENGKEPPLDLLGVHRIVSAIVGKRPKTMELKGLDIRPGGTPDMDQEPF